MSAGFFIYGIVSIIGFSLLFAWAATKTVERRGKDYRWK